MPSNVEIKARATDAAWEETLRRARALSAAGNQEGEVIIDQEDVFFHVPQGRLKLRKQMSGGGGGEAGDSSGACADDALLIFYDRDDAESSRDVPRPSHYQMVRVQEAEQLERVLTCALGGAGGVRGRVKKRRILHVVGQTRIHLDQVEGLGKFVELEVVLKEGQEVEDGRRIADDLMVELGIRKEDLLVGAYMDMLMEPPHSSGKP